MKIKDIVEILGAEVICRNDLLETEVERGFGSDMMSEVLAFVKEQSVLLTGLVNPQVIRTAEMIDMPCIIFVRGKRPDLKMIEMAEDRDMVILCCELSMFTACGRLYAEGLRGGMSE